MFSYNHRCKRLVPIIAAAGYDGFLVTGRSNCRYLSGFTGSNGYLLVTSSDLVLFTDFRYVEQAKSECPHVSVTRIRDGYRSLSETIAQFSLRSVAFEPDHITFGEHKSIYESLSGDVSFTPASQIVEELRGKKDEFEIEILSEAVRIADLAMAEATSCLGEGVREYEVADVIERALKDAGASGTAFDTIVASGPNSALPHHKAGARVISEGDSVVIDMGALYQGYRSDLTRTYSVGDFDRSKYDEIYGIVLEAQMAAEAAASPGMLAMELDSVARDIIGGYGYGSFFGHGLGHGVGIDVHESPMVVPSSGDRIFPGSVFTIEPGIYIPGWGGVRIEDVLVMGDLSAQVLTLSPK